MFDFLQGRVEEVGAGRVVLRSAGVGWELWVSARCAADLSPGMRRRLPVHLAVSDSAFTLYGFRGPKERAVFRRLLQVSGVGPTAALALLSALEPAELAAAVRDQATARLTVVKGIGRKTAERLLLELRDHVDELAAGEVLGAARGADDLQRVLVELGFRDQEARSAADSARRALGDDADFQQLLKTALQTARA